MRKEIKTKQNLEDPLKPHEGKRHELEEDFQENIYYNCHAM